MKIATWNIAGGHTAKSSKAFDYSTRNLNYFANQLAALNPDVLCLQEAEYELSGSLSLANYFAEQLNMPFVFETRMHASHITPGCGIALAILSKEPFDTKRSVVQPYPSFPLYLPNGKPAAKHIKHLQIAEIHGIQIANTHTQPLELLGTPYASEKGRAFADELCDLFIRELRPPLVFAGDFCADLHGSVTEIYQKMCDALSLTDVLPPGQTKPNNTGRPDAILTSPELTAQASGIIQTETDHFLCWADITPASA